MEQNHPVINFIYFSLVIGFTMVIMHPVCLLVSFFSAFCYVIHLFGWKQAGKGLLAMAGIMLLTAIINPAFNHQGMTTLCYLSSGNILTLESICYGLAAACMLGATVMWFRCVSEILTGDKIVYLFGKTFPVLGLLLSMILGFVPKLQRKYAEIQRCRGKKNVENISILITWVLEDAVETADSMRARGYGLERRTTFTIYPFTKKDKVCCIYLLVCGGYILFGILSGKFNWSYYPVMSGSGLQIYPVSIYIVYLLICVFPLAEDYLEERAWNKLQSTI